MPQDDSKGATTFAFTDTNVFIHYEFFKNVDWAAELAAREVTLVVPAGKCAHTGQLIDLASMQIDHVIPETLGHEPELLAKR